MGLAECLNGPIIIDAAISDRVNYVVQYSTKLSASQAARASARSGIVEPLRPDVRVPRILHLTRIDVHADSRSFIAFQNHGTTCTFSSPAWNSAKGQ